MLTLLIRYILPQTPPVLSFYKVLTKNHRFEVAGHQPVELLTRRTVPGTLSEGWYILKFTLCHVITTFVYLLSSLNSLPPPHSLTVGLWDKIPEIDCASQCALPFPPPLPCFKPVSTLTVA